VDHIERWLRRAVEAAAAGDIDCCILLESLRDVGSWVQLTWDTVNAAYPFADDPMARVRAAGVPEYPYCELTAWEPEKYATFEHPAEPLDRVAGFVAAYFERVLGVSAAEGALRVLEE
jgi:hypothetical protein